MDEDESHNPEKDWFYRKKLTQNFFFVLFFFLVGKKKYGAELGGSESRNVWL